MTRQLILLVVAAVLLSHLSGSVQASSARPNVLFIAVDDLNDWIGCLGGHPDCKSPHIDALAKRGVLFANSHCAAPACNPSRVALLTGLRPSTTGVYINPQPWRPALPDVVTLPQHFMAHGYHVVGCGKIFHGRYHDPASWHEYLSRSRDPVPAPEVLNSPRSHSGGLTRGIRWGVLDVDDAAMNDSKMVDWAISYLQRPHDKPFFLACGIFRPHMPWRVPRKYYDMYPPAEIALPKVLETDLDDVPEAGRKVAKPDGDHRLMMASGNWRYATQAYLASITFADAQVGRLLAALDSSGQAEETIIVLWGDHGWHLGEKLHWRKFSLWEEATRAPLMIVAPGVTTPGGICRRPVDFVNIYPTLCELCNLPIESHLDGRSMTDLLKDPDTPRVSPAITTFGRNNHAVRGDRYRYIRYADGSEELYDHHSDPMEWTNLSAKEELANEKQRLAASLPAVNAPNVPFHPRRNRRSVPSSR